MGHAGAPEALGERNHAAETNGEGKEQHQSKGSKSETEHQRSKSDRRGSISLTLQLRSYKVSGAWPGDPDSPAEAPANGRTIIEFNVIGCPANRNVRQNNDKLTNRLRVAHLFVFIPSGQKHASGTQWLRLHVTGG